MDTTSFNAALYNPDYQWNMTVLNHRQRGIVAYRAEQCAAYGGFLETLTGGYAEWRKAETRRVAAVKAAATRAINKAAAGK